MVFWKRAGQRSATSPHLEPVVRQHLPEADDATVQLVSAVAGLLGCVAFADREYSELERQHVRDVLGRVQGLTSAGVEAVCAALDADIVHIAMANPQAYTRTLREQGSVDMRREVLEVLVDLAASDHTLSFEETQLLRRIASALGLDQDDYNQAQARHRERLSTLKG